MLGFALLFLAQGGKDRLAFALWAIFALGNACFILLREAPNPKTLRLYVLLILGLGCSQLFSQDPQASLYWTLQYMTFATVGLAMIVSARRNEALFWHGARLAGVVSGIMTFYQICMIESRYGFLPLNPNFNALLLSCLAVGLLNRERPHRWDLLIAFSLAALVPFTYSISALIGLALGLSYTVVRRFGWLKLGMSVVGLSLVMTIGGRDWLVEQYLQLHSDSRVQIWGVALQALRDHGIFGWGAGNFEFAYFRYAFPTLHPVRYAFSTEFAHNDLLQLASELGVLVVALLAWMLYTVLRQLKHKRSNDPEIAMLITLAAASCFNTFLRLPLFIDLVLLLVIRLRSDAIRVPDGKTKNTTPIYRALIGLIVGILAAPLGWYGIRSHWARGNKWAAIVAHQSRDAEALHELALQTNDLKVALPLHARAVIFAPNTLYYVEALARALESTPGTDRLGQATHFFSFAMKLAPKRATNFLCMARLRWREGKIDEALQWAKDAEMLEPNYFEATLWRARCLASLHHPEEAINTLKDLQNRYEMHAIEVPHALHSAYTEEILRYDAPTVAAELAAVRDRTFHRVQ